MKNLLKKIGFGALAVLTAGAAHAAVGPEMGGLCGLITELKSVFNILRTLAFVGAAFVIASIGWDAITKKEYNATKQSWINAYKKPNTKLDDKNSIDNQTRDILVLNAALKTEAQKRGISYSQAEIDKYSLPKYNEKGGKFLYIKAYERDYQWTEQDVMLRRTNDYLQYKLKDKLIKDRVYSEVYIRWDNIRIQKTEDINKPAPAEEEKAGQILKEKYLPLFEQKKSAAELEKAVDIRDGDSLEQQKKAYASTRGTKGTSATASATSN
jgi:hypothetical protein